MANTAMYTDTDALITVTDVLNTSWKRTREGRYTAPQSGPKKPTAVTIARINCFRAGGKAEYGAGGGGLGGADKEAGVEPSDGTDLPLRWWLSPWFLRTEERGWEVFMDFPGKTKAKTVEGNLSSPSFVASGIQ
ncbi:hypothetical protein CIHG_02366 [Coccidioides immitis H538.4]|uniref:Uncharacterized protein n=1 Tax=Coccidioides immitis H538.4 TaxID=396776 RepID=A0A0J8RIT8_COCIT|nr:hypothetical protein CIHG_02366 [Coccidioides immitis H538.4]